MESHQRHRFGFTPAALQHHQEPSPSSSGYRYLAKLLVSGLLSSIDLADVSTSSSWEAGSGKRSERKLLGEWTVVSFVALLFLKLLIVRILNIPGIQVG
jgi:hypothetical protein